ncbi:hypothetical protein [Thermosipho melanesiensis]|nr:hypothetical protein [Thermosipho melanesiensis]
MRQVKKVNELLKQEKENIKKLTNWSESAKEFSKVVFNATEAVNAINQN